MLPSYVVVTVVTVTGASRNAADDGRCGVACEGDVVVRREGAAKVSEIAEDVELHTCDGRFGDVEQGRPGRQSPAIVAERSIAAHDPVAGHDERRRIRRASRTHHSNRTR